MKITQSDTNDGKIRLDIVAPAGQVDAVVRAAGYVLAMQNGLQVDPEGKEDMRELVIEKVGEPQYNAFVNNYVMNYLAPFAVNQRNLEIIMNPDTYSDQQVQAGKDYAFRAIVTPKPSYELKSYDPVSVRVPMPSITDEQIEQQLYALAQNNAEFKDDPDAVVKEDSDIEFSMETTDESGEPVRNLTAEKRYYTLGQQFMPEGFDQALLGMKAGETREFDFELPESNDPDSPMHKMHCKVTMASVKRRIVPAITDAWVEVNIPEAKNVPGLRELIRQQGEEQLAKEIENRKFFAVAAELATRFQGSIADEVYEFTRGELMRDLTQSIQQQGMTLQEFMKQQGMEEQQFSMQMMMEVRETLRQGFSLDALARHLGLTVTDEDINDTLTRMAPGREEQVRREFEGTGRMYMLREAAMRTKANKWLYDTATFEYVDASQFAPMM